MSQQFFRPTSQQDGQHCNQGFTSHRNLRGQNSIASCLSTRKQQGFPHKSAMRGCTRVEGHFAKTLLDVVCMMVTFKNLHSTSQHEGQLCDPRTRLSRAWLIYFNCLWIGNKSWSKNRLNPINIGKHFGFSLNHS